MRTRYIGGVSDLRNVIVFAVRDQRYAIEIRWVREMVSLGFVTTVPTAPAALLGLCNLHGTIVAVIDIPALLPAPSATNVAGGAPLPTVARQGDGAIVVEVAGSPLAMRVDKIERVVSLPFDDDRLIDTTQPEVKLLAPETLLRLLTAQFDAAAAHEEQALRAATVPGTP